MARSTVASDSCPATTIRHCRVKAASIDAVANCRRARGAFAGPSKAEALAIQSNMIITLVTLVKAKQLMEAPPAPAQPQLVCVGDSITFGSKASSPTYNYPSQLQTRFDIALQDFQVTNLGVSGATVQKSGDNPYWSTEAYARLVNQTWDVAVVMLGTNDAKPYNWAGQDAFLNDYRALLAQIRADATFVMVPPPLMLDGAYDMNQTVINDLFPVLVPELAPVVDVFSSLGGHAAWRDDFPAGGCALDSDWAPCAYFCSNQSCDQCHPNDVGNAWLATTVFSALTPALQKRPSAAC